ncbi:5-oxoprolinase subunit B family protein [Coraliomargarita sp. W4R53]
MELKPYGDRGILLAALSEVERSVWLHRLALGLPAGCEEYVVGYDSILLIGQGIVNDQSLKERIDSFVACPLVDPQGADASLPVSPSANLGDSHSSTDFAQNLQPQHVIEVSYNGADLVAVAQACGLTVAQVIERHSAPIYTVRMMGFSPGFPYLEGLDPRLHLDRRNSPRNRIEPGTVAIGGSHAGIYSVASPGGWHLLGHTDFTLFDRNAARQTSPSAHEVFALSAGAQVRFQPKEVF